MSNRILEYWHGTNLYRWVIKWSQKTTLPGFARLSLYTVVGFIWKEIKRDDITTRANSVAFSFMLSLFPTIIFLFTLVPLLPISNLDDIINGYLNDFLPNNATNFLKEIITDLTKKKRGGLLSVGFIMAVYFASNGMMALMRGFEKTYDDTFKKRTGVEKRVIAIRMTFLLAILVIGSALFIILSNLIFGTLFKWSRLEVGGSGIAVLCGYHHHISLCHPHEAKAALRHTRSGFGYLFLDLFIDRFLLFCQ